MINHDLTDGQRRELFSDSVKSEQKHKRFESMLFFFMIQRIYSKNVALKGNTHMAQIKHKKEIQCESVSRKVADVVTNVIETNPKADGGVSLTCCQCAG